MYPSVLSRSGKRAAALVFAVIFSALAAGCHRNNLDSGYSIGWITLTDEPSAYASYIVQVDSVILTGVNNGEVTVLDIPETVDFTKITNVSELWGSASIPNDTYYNAIITIDYTDADISILVNGVPTQATVLDSTGVAATQVAVQVNLDPNNKAYSIPTYATTAGIRLALDFDMAASNRIDLSTSPPTVTVQPFFTAATSSSDQKPILVRGPLVNTSLLEESYSIYVRPFYDEVNTSGTLTLFDTNSPLTGGSSTTTPTPSCPKNTPVYTINGTAYPGSSAINVLSETSAGSTMTEAVTTYVPTVTPSATAAIFCVNYMIGGSTLEDFYTFGLEGDVIARSGNTLTVRGPILFLTSDEYVTGLTADYQVLLGTGTLVTEDGLPSDAGLNYNSVSVGQHIIARGVCNVTTITNAIGVVVNTCVSQNGYPTLDSTGTSSTNTGSVRIQSTQIFGSVVTNATGSLGLNLTGFNQYPASVYNFAGTGSTPAVATDYLVNTGSLALPTDLTVGGPVWVNGAVAPFGSAPPDFNALSVLDEISMPATLVVNYQPSVINTNPFSTLSATDGISVNLADTLIVSAQINIGAESIDMTTLPASPVIVPVTVPPYPAPITVPTANLTTADLPPTFLPLFCAGSTANGIGCYNTFSAYVGEVISLFATKPNNNYSLYTVTARGTYNRTTNQFTADAVDMVWY